MAKASLKGGPAEESTIISCILCRKVLKNAMDLIVNLETLNLLETNKNIFLFTVKERKDIFS
jgi:hypothetical protein